MTVCSTNYSLLPIFPSLGPSLLQCVADCVAKLSIDVTAPMRRRPRTGPARSLSTNLFHDRALFMRDERSSISAPVCGESGGRILQYRSHRRRWRQGVLAGASRSPAIMMSLPPLSLSLLPSLHLILPLHSRPISFTLALYLCGTDAAAPPHRSAEIWGPGDILVHRNYAVLSNTDVPHSQTHTPSSTLKGFDAG